MRRPPARGAEPVRGPCGRSCRAERPWLPGDALL